MLKETLLILSLFSLSTSYTYAPFHQRKFEYSISDLCSYDDNNFQYVKPCQTNYQCKDLNGGDTHDIRTCKEYVNKIIKIFGDSCTYDIECDSGLECSSSKCVCFNDYSPYKIKDRVSGDYYYYCNDNYKATGSNSNAKCVSTNDNTVSGISSNLCYQTGTDGTNIKTVLPDFGLVCGQNTWESYSSSSSSPGYKYKKETKMNRMGTLDDGTFVTDERACKSGFALELFLDQTPKQPSNGDPAKDSVCVTLNGVDFGENNIVIYKYSLKNTEYSYNTKSSSGSSDAAYLMTKLELFKEYVNKAKDINCSKGSGYDNEQFTCGNDDLRRAWYFYNNPKNYLLYKNEDAIIDYLLQLSYPDYKPRYSEPQQASGYLNIKFISLLILLLSL